MEASKPLRFPKLRKTLPCAKDVIGNQGVEIFVDEGMVKGNGASDQVLLGAFQMGCSPCSSNETNIIELDAKKIDDLVDVPFQGSLPFGQPVHAQDLQTGEPRMNPSLRWLQAFSV